jgi:hypothetical protein
MLRPQQFGPQQVTTYYQPTQLDISQIMNMVLPIMMMAMVFAMITPMFKGMTSNVA